MGMGKEDAWYVQLQSKLNIEELTYGQQGLHWKLADISCVKHTAASI